MYCEFALIYNTSWIKPKSNSMRDYTIISGHPFTSAAFWFTTKVENSILSVGMSAELSNFPLTGVEKFYLMDRLNGIIEIYLGR